MIIKYFLHFLILVVGAYAGIETGKAFVFRTQTLEKAFMKILILGLKVQLLAYVTMVIAHLMGIQ